MSVVAGSFGARLLARTSNLKALTIGQLRAEEKTLRLVIFNISKTLQKQLLRQGSPRKAQGNTANTRAQIALFQNRLTLVIREIQNRGQQQKLIGDIRDQPFTENGITTSTSQFVLGSTTGAVSSLDRSFTVETQTQRDQFGYTIASFLHGTNITRIIPIKWIMQLSGNRPQQSSLIQLSPTNTGQTIIRTVPFDENSPRIIEVKIFAEIDNQIVSNTESFKLFNPFEKPVTKSASFEIRFTDLPNENFSSNTSFEDFNRLGQEAQGNGRWHISLRARPDTPAQFTFEQVITTIDAILAKPLPMDGCGVGFHRDENGLCVPDEPEPDEERNLFNTAIIGAIGIGVLASMMGNKK